MPLITTDTDLHISVSLYLTELSLGEIHQIKKAYSPSKINLLNECQVYERFLVWNNLRNFTYFSLPGNRYSYYCHSLETR